MGPKLLALLSPIDYNAIKRLLDVPRILGDSSSPKPSARLDAIES
jgi:hypothetical protein